MNQDPNSRVLINNIDDNKNTRKVPLKRIVSTDTGLSLHPIKIKGEKTSNFSISGGEEKIIYLT